MDLVLTKNFYTWMRTVLLGTSTSISASTSSTNVTIGEIGMFKRIQVNSSVAEQFFFGRIALERSIPLSAGESATFQISVEL